MSGPYTELLDAAIHHLEELKAGGVKFLSVDPVSLTALQTLPGNAAAPANPAATRRAPAAIAPALREPSPPARPASQSAAAPSSPAFDSEILTGEARSAAMKELREQALVCTKCPHLASSRKNVVFGVGDIQAELMFVGEAPGSEEDTEGEPFVGRAGQLLTRIIQTMGFSRETVYIGNVLKCRPDTPGQSYGNRKPTPDEMKTCLPFLERQIEIIRPKVIVALGATAVEGLLGLESAGITRLRGNWRAFRGIPVMPTFHPSFLLRPENASKKRLVWEDMLLVLERLCAPVTEKQRGYFLKPG